MQHDAITYAQKILNMINEIDTLVDRLQEAGEIKATGISNYDRKLAITVLKLKNGMIGTIEDEDGTFISIPSNLAVRDRELIAKGIVYMAAYEKESGEAGYKGIISMLEAKRAQLNGLQSINKVLQ
jgi:hypothetical protein